MHIYILLKKTKMTPILTILLIGIASTNAAIQKNENWQTCGNLKQQYNRTACPLESATCCTQKWMPSDGTWGCCPYPNAVCCSNGYNCCPAGTKCQDIRGQQWGVVTKCISADNNKQLIVGGGKNKISSDKINNNIDNDDPDFGLAAQVCKSGGPLPLSTTKKNIVIMGDSVSIGYYPFIKESMADVALVQHSPWDQRDGGVEETEYGWRCLEYLLRPPTGTFIVPDILYFNWGLHNISPNLNQTIPGQSGPPSAYAPYLEKIVNRLDELYGPKSNTKTKLIFGITSPMICSKETDDIVQANNIDAESIMSKYNITTVNLHKAIVNKCGPAPQVECFGETNCFCPHCPANGGRGYKWLANTVIVPVLEEFLL